MRKLKNTQSKYYRSTAMTTEQQEKMQSIIQKISNTRKSNNLNWMKLLKLAVIYAPQEALVCMKGIRDCDGSIQTDFESLVDELERAVK
jgi:hypothetical protein